MSQAQAIGNSPSTYETVKNTVVDAAYWCGHQVKNVYDAVAGFIAKIANYVAPFFKSIGNFVCEQYDRVKDFLVQHKDIAIPVTAALAFGAIAFGLIQAVMCAKPAAKPNQA